MAAQVFGQDVVRTYELAVQGKLEQANALQDRLVPLYDLMYSGACSPYTAIKWGMKFLSRPGGYPRPPFLPPDEATCRKIQEAVSVRNL